MEQIWKRLKHFKEESDFIDYLITGLKLQNADAIVQKLVAEGAIPYAKGTRRLRYAGGTFYVEALASPMVPLADIGVGKHINIKALQEHWQGMAPNIRVTIKLDAHMETVVSVKEYEEKGVCGIHVRLNPTKLKGPKQVEECVQWVEAQI